MEFDEFEDFTPEEAHEQFTSAQLPYLKSVLQAAVVVGFPIETAYDFDPMHPESLHDDLLRDAFLSTHTVATDKSSADIQYIADITYLLYTAYDHDFDTVDTSEISALREQYIIDYKQFCTEDAQLDKAVELANLVTSELVEPLILPEDPNRRAEYLAILHTQVAVEAMEFRTRMRETSVARRIVSDTLTALGHEEKDINLPVSFTVMNMSMIVMRLTTAWLLEPEVSIDEVFAEHEDTLQEFGTMLEEYGSVDARSLLHKLVTILSLDIETFPSDEDD